jgi:hypothetical protein
LTSNDKEYLHPFNFTHICKGSLTCWGARQQVVDELIRIQDSGKWQESGSQNYLGNLIGQLNGPAKDVMS